MTRRIKSIFRFLFGILMLSSLSGCLDIYFTTEIKANGEIVKTIVLEGDSTEILETYLPVIDNDTWDREWLAGDDDKSKLVLKKSFSKDQDAVADLNPPDSTPTLRMVPELKKQFRWFFTYYKYKETILETNPFQKLNWTDYLTPEEIDLCLMDEDEREKDPRYNKEEYEKTEKRFGEVLLKSAFKEFYDLFMLALNQSTNITLTAEQVIQNKDKLFNKAIESDNNDTVEDLIEIFSKALNSDDPKIIYKQNTDLLNWFNLKMDYFSNAFDDNLHFTIRMPGLLLDSNSDEIKGNNASWSVDSFSDAFLKDYEMTAESRMVNNWTFVVTGILVVFLLVLIIYAIWRKKKMA